MSFILRWVLAIVFFFSSLGKALDLNGFTAVLASYYLFPTFSLTPIGVGLIIIEFKLALLLISGWQITKTAVVTSIMYVIYTVVMLITFIRQVRVPNSGWFGTMMARPVDWERVAEALVLLIMSMSLILIVRQKPHRE